MELRDALVGTNGDDSGVMGMLARLPQRSRALGVEAETVDAVRRRTLGALDDVARATSASGGGDVLAVSSGIAIAVALESLGADPALMRGGIRNASVSVLHWSGDWEVVRVNDTESRAS